MNDITDLLTILNRYRMDNDDGFDSGFKVNRLFGLHHLILDNLNSESIICEVGSFRGSSSALFAYYCKKVYCVDLFDKSFNGLDYEPLFDDTMKEFENVEKIKSSSIEASKLFENNFFDLVYIDASHLYKDVVDDIKYWKPKVKENGLLSGHDFMYDVAKAVIHTIGLPNKVYSDSSWIKKLGG